MRTHIAELVTKYGQAHAGACTRADIVEQHRPSVVTECVFASYLISYIHWAGL